MTASREPRYWKKSTRSQNTSHCIEVGFAEAGAAVRDTKNRADGYFVVGSAQWLQFLGAIKVGRYDR